MKHFIALAGFGLLMISQFNYILTFGFGIATTLVFATLYALWVDFAKNRIYGLK